MVLVHYHLHNLVSLLALAPVLVCKFKGQKQKNLCIYNQTEQNFPFINYPQKSIFHY